MSDAPIEKFPPYGLSQKQCFSSGFKLVRMSIEDSFEKGHRRLYLRAGGGCQLAKKSLFQLTRSFSKSESYVRWRKIYVGWRKIEQEGPWKGSDTGFALYIEGDPEKGSNKVMSEQRSKWGEGASAKVLRWKI